MKLFLSYITIVLTFVFSQNLFADYQEIATCEVVYPQALASISRSSGENFDNIYINFLDLNDKKTVIEINRIPTIRFDTKDVAYSPAEETLKGEINKTDSSSSLNQFIQIKKTEGQIFYQYWQKTTCTGPIPEACSTRMGLDVNLKNCVFNKS